MKLVNIVIHTLFTPRGFLFAKRGMDSKITSEWQQGKNSINRKNNKFGCFYSIQEIRSFLATNPLTSPAQVNSRGSCWSVSLAQLLLDGFFAAPPEPVVERPDYRNLPASPFARQLRGWPSPRAMKPSTPRQLVTSPQKSAFASTQPSEFFASQCQRLMSDEGSRTVPLNR